MFIRSSMCLVVISVAYAQEPLSASRAANPDAIAATAAGSLSEANAAWWGFEEADSTSAIQSAIDSMAAKVVVPYVGKPWIIRPIMLRGDLELFFEPGVVVLAKKDEFRSKGDSLFRAQDASNISVRGYGATLRMRKRDYQQPPYEKAEWRMGLTFSGCTNVRVEGLRIESTGGDGIYIGTTGTQEYCKDVVIREVTCFDNHRQGISVIGAENLLIENSVFANTWGTAPGAGIDLEPDSPAQRLVNIVVRNCTFENNEGHEVLVYAKNLDATAPPISIRFENCLMRKTTLDMLEEGIGRDDDVHGWAGISVGAVRDDGPEGLIEFVDCTVEGTGKESVKVYDKSADKAKVRFVNCRFKDSWNVHHSIYADMRVPIFFEVRRPALSKRVGGIEFVDCHLWDDAGRPVAAMSPFNSEYGLHDVTGTIYVYGENEPRVWFGKDSTNVDLQLVQIKPAEPADSRKPDADAE
ncbi:MAG: right-handed parallel beta-helix repeat-containing protein [Candidatus Hydrogenedentes bacterium]|nr:right-handed parallel beta-helix repeat-containing protein [Candidatus Hydrogenedentota bacterium]